MHPPMEPMNPCCFSMTQKMVGQVIIVCQSGTCMATFSVLCILVCSGQMDSASHTHWTRQAKSLLFATLFRDYVPDEPLLLQHDPQNATPSYHYLSACSETTRIITVCLREYSMTLCTIYLCMYTLFSLGLRHISFVRVFPLPLIVSAFINMTVRKLRQDGISSSASMPLRMWSYSFVRSCVHALANV